MKIQLQFINNEDIKKTILLFVTISTFLLYFLSSEKIYGSTISYLIFSISSFFLVIIGLVQKKSIGYMLFSIFIYLGFFIKHSFHLIFSYDYLEPIGRFDNSYSQWNEFYEISSMGFISFIVLGIYLIYMNKNLPNISFQFDKQFVLNTKSLNILWFILIILGISLLILNEIFQSQKLGIVKEHIFNSWFLEMSIIMFISIIFPILMYLISFFEINQRNNFYKTIFFIILASSLFSVSILSGSVVVFWCMPLLFLPIFKKISLKQYIYVFVLYIFFIFFTVGVSTLLRNSSVSTFVTTPTSKSVNKSINAFNRLLIDRWIGTEGLMIVVGMENKSMNNLFYERKSNEIDFFTKNALNYEVEKGHELTSYATLPGIIGYLYLSGSKVVLFFGCFFFVFLIILIERVILYFTQNFLLSTYLAISLASSIAGFGIDLISWIKVQIFTILVVSVIYFIFIKFLKGKEI